MKRLLKIIAALTAVSGFAGSALAVDGVDGYYNTTYRAPDMNWYDVDLEIDGFYGYTYAPGSSEPDGTLYINGDATSTHFSGTWERGGSSGTFVFNFYQGKLRGFYNSPDTNGMQLPWNSN